MNLRRLFALALLGLVLPSLAYSDCISLSSLGTAYTQDFDTLASSGTSSTLPDGWAFVESGTGANATYTAGIGSSNTGDTYSFGATGNGERALGTLLSGSVVTTFGACFDNDTGSTINQLSVAYTGEMWRLGATAREDRLEFNYSLNATSLTSGSWTAVTALNFVAPVTAGTVGPLNGNNSANRTAVSSSISGLSIAPGSSFWIRWNDLNATGSDDGLAVDDFSITPSTSLVPTNPSASAAANPSSVNAEGSTLLTVTVTPGTNPTSTGITVTGDLSSIGGSATQTFYDNGTNGDVTGGDNIFSFSATVGGATTPGAKSLPISVSDAQSRTASASIGLTVAAPAVSPGTIVISQVYGGGGNSGATYKNDFIELFNRSTATVSLVGYSVQYGSSGGTTWSATPLTGSVAPGGYYLVQASAGSGGTEDLPTPDDAGGLTLAAGAGKIALVTNSTPLTGGCPSSSTIVDLVGYGGANCFEGGAPARTLSNTTAAFRNLNGCSDTNDNNRDFFTGSPAPRNSAAPIWDCNAPFPTLAINQIQGSTSTSPYAGQLVMTTTAVVTALTSNGFVMQTPSGSGDDDANPATSEGLFVFTGSPRPDVPVLGDAVTVKGIVTEFIPSSDIYSPSKTQLAQGPEIVVVSSGNPMPAPVTITMADTDPDGGFEQLEKYEFMRVKIDSLTVVAPTQGNKNEAAATATSNGVFYGVLTGMPRPFREPGIQLPDPLPLGAPCCVPRFDGNPERIRVASTAQPGAAAIDVSTGAVVTNLIGPLDFSFRTWTILPDPGVAEASPVGAADPIRLPEPNEFAVASFNMERFYDTVNDPATSDVVMTEAAYANRLTKASIVIRDLLRMPDIIGVEEVENLAVLQDVAARVNADAVAASQPNPQYVAYLEEGNDVGGIDVGFLVKSTRVNVIDVVQVGKNATYINPQNNQPETLNDRPSLVMRATIQPPAGSPYPVTVIVNHLRSLLGMEDPATGARVRAKRQAQAEYLAQLIQTMQSSDPTRRIISVGDYNAFQFNDGWVDIVGTIRGEPAPADQVINASPDLVNPNLVDLVDHVIPSQRYSYTFDGNAQEIDHILITQNLMSRFSSLEYGRANADFPEILRSNPNRPEKFTDHDIPVAYFTFPASNAAPVLGAIGNRSGSEGAILSFSINATDVNSDPLLYSATGLPAGALLDGATGAFNWTPSYTQAGEYSVTFTASDGIESDSETITIEIANVNTTPVLSAIGNRMVATGSLLAFTVSAADTDGDSLTYDATGLPAGATFNPSTRQFSWTPANDQGGDWQVAFSVSDGVNSDAETITITVTVPGLEYTSMTLDFGIYNQGRAGALPSQVRAVLSDHATLDTHVLGTGRDVALDVQMVEGADCEGAGCVPALAPGALARYTSAINLPASGFGRHLVADTPGNQAVENANGSFTLTSAADTSSRVRFLFGRYIWIEADSARDGNGNKLDESKQILPALMANDAQRKLISMQAPAFGELTHLSAVFEAISGGAGQGSPRLEVHFEGHGKLLIRLGSSPGYNDGNAALNAFSWFNVIGDSADRYDTRELVGAAAATGEYVDYASALGAAGEFTISSINFVAGETPDAREYRLQRINVGVGESGASLRRDEPAPQQ